MLTGYETLWPYAVLLLAAFWALFSDLLPGRDRGASAVGAVAAFVAAALFAVSSPDAILFGSKLVFAPDSRLIAIAVTVLAGVWMLWTYGRGEGRTREAVALALLSTMGASLMASSADFVVMALALELTSMPAYVITGYRRNRLGGLEGAIKYFLLSVLTTLFMLYGLSFVYGLSGTTAMQGLALMPSTVLSTVAALLVLVGIFAKLSAAPFHFWAPDAYEGAEPWAVAFVSTIPKLGGIAVASRIALYMLPAMPSFSTILGVVAIASMVLGAFAALTQRDTRRIIAYSGVVNTGYMLIPLATIGATGGLNVQTALIATLLYAVMYATATMGVMLVAAKEGGQVADLVGLSRRRPAAAWALAILVLSLIGVPPMAGFFGKFYMFLVGIQGGLLAAVIVATVVSVVSAFYYLRLVKAAFFGSAEFGTVEPGGTDTDALDVAEPSEQGVAAAAIAPYRGWSSIVAVALTVVITLGLGLASGQVMNWIVGA